MTEKTHKITYGIIKALMVVGVFEALIAILNLNQPELYFKTAFYAGLFFILQIALLYDLHFKSRGNLAKAKIEIQARFWKIFLVALKSRLRHLFKRHFVKSWLNYLIMPGIIYWGTLLVIFVNFGFPRIQHTFSALSSLAIFLNFLYVKEIFSKKEEKVYPEAFVVLSMLKIYASFIAYVAGLAIIKNYCLDPWYLILSVFSVVFLLIYQALFQHRMGNARNLSFTVLIAAVMSIAAYLVLLFWGYNYFSAAVILVVLHNLMWGAFHYSLDRALTARVLGEILLISAIIVIMIFSATNFKARIFDSCGYGFTSNRLSPEL